jgi:outer membrane protein OmpA-like peptidoglycan-associated protein
MRKRNSRISGTSPRVTLPPVASLLALGGVLALAACGDFWRNVPPRPAATDDPAVAATPYPSVNSVPARPQLSYPLEQRREIAEGLVADRANARHAGDALRQGNARPGLADQPVPLPSPPAAPASRAQGTMARPQGDLALAYVEEALARDADNGTLDDFLDRLQQPPIGPGPRSAERAAAAAPAKEAQADRARRARPAAAPAPSPSDDGVLEEQPRPKEPSLPESPSQEAAADLVPTTIEPAAGDIGAPPVDTLAAPVEAAAAASVTAPAAPRLPMTVLFAADDTAIAARDTAKLEALAHANGDLPRLFVVGNGPRPGLAMERARGVAALLVGAGIPAERLVIEMGGESNVVIVYEPDGDTG